LEGRLDDIVSLLQPQAAAKQRSLKTDLPLPENHDAPLNLDALRIAEDSTSTRSGLTTNAPLNSPTSFAFDALPTPARTTTDSNIGHDGQSTSPIGDNVAFYEIPDVTANNHLDTFSRSFLPFFPFIYIPASLSASDLRQQKPFLWLVIMSLTTKSVEQQRAMGNTIRYIVSQKVVAEHEKSMDILLGLICYLAW
jgi:hypothetical protein